jgi:hypothetical protein
MMVEPVVVTPLEDRIHRRHRFEIQRQRTGQRRTEPNRGCQQIGVQAPHPVERRIGGDHQQQAQCARQNACFAKYCSCVVKEKRVHSHKERQKEQNDTIDENNKVHKHLSVAGYRNSSRGSISRR